MYWDDLRFLLSVQRQGGYKAAARALGVDPTTVGRRIAALETAFGARLVLRTPERVELTAAGAALAGRAERIEAEVLASERELTAADARVEGTLRVTAGDAFVHYVLLPALGALRRQHPLLCLELRPDARVLDLSRREADVAIRLQRPKEPSLVARRIGDMPLGLFASHGYLEQRGVPRSVARLASHDLIGFDAAFDDLPQVKWLHRLLREPRYVVRANTATAQVVACAEGHGIALLPLFVAPREPRLRALFPRLIGPSRELWSVTHGDLRTNARVTAFQGFVAELVRALPRPHSAAP